MKQALLKRGRGQTSLLHGVISISLAALLFAGMAGTAEPQTAYAEEGAAEPGTVQDTGAADAASSADAPNTTPKEEVVYARLAGDGAVESIYVVNVLNPAEAGTVVDYGNYESVQNLTDTGELTLSGDKVTAGVSETSFSYQGDCTSKDLPWNIVVTYTLDGTPKAASDLAGAEGDLEISIITKPNSAVDASFYDNYLVQISIVFPEEKSSNISAPDGQIALVGSNTQVTFAGMPGKEGSFKAAAKIHDFEMEGISIAAVPFSMAIDAPDTADFISGFRQLGDGVSQLSTGAQGLASGAQSLSGGITQLGTGVQGVSDGASDLASGLSQVAGYSEQIMEGMGQLSDAGYQVSVGSSGFNSGLQGLSQAADSTQQLMQYDPEIAALLQSKPEFAGLLGSLTAGVIDLSTQYNDFDTGVQGFVGGVDQMATDYTSFDEGIVDLSSGAQSLADGASQLPGGVSSLSTGASELASGAGQLSSGSSTLSTEIQSMPDTVQDEIDKMMADYDKSDYVPVSFTSPKNTNVNLTQFVIASEPIKLPEDEKIPEPEDDGTILSRFLALFGIGS